ncbi:UbiH/UbiF family hydroxylase [Rhizobium sp. RU36D]|uniref:UbiH/UbiF family hydroxylase n=1 Tax=Rhizobium sp. RU36D TaxID=1907415 RepID=UPI0009D8563F|nr:UbiH/UbiF family hydroxylase [Rhizobium sp. RU36D]SMC67496.1 2-octaprenyl-3-methyl-6-methoxy-1,4-benzoquinol hydroxylase [Rhizobium sp. RU36D]
MSRSEVAVVGGGLAGMTAALTLARGGRKVALIAPAPGVADGRTTALMDQSIRLLDRLGVWGAIAPSAAALSTMQILDGTRRLFRAPPVAFRSSEIGLPAFGYNMPNTALLAVLADHVRQDANITLYDSSAQSFELGSEQATIMLDQGDKVQADFVIGADGRRSAVREAAGIGTRTWSYPQTALVLNFAHTIPHRNVSTEFHGESGPFTQVPLPGNRSSLVWVLNPAIAEQMMALDVSELSRRVEERMQSMLGTVSVEDGAQTWPLSGMTAHRFGKGRVALVGEAAHAFPPIGAQGLNLSLRDVMALESLLCSSPDMPISGTAGDAFDRKRRTDVISRTASVDLLNRSLLSDFVPVQMVRAAGLHVLSTIAPLRHIVMQEGIEPGRGFSALPRMLREKVRR